jgi:16S rRNA (cytosine967-C5)-methyltransferase
MKDTNKEVNVRELAFFVLFEVLEKDSYLNYEEHSILEKHPYLKKQDRAFLFRLCEGVVERKLTLDYILDQHSKVKTKKMKPVIRTILRMGVYQLIFMDSVPASAACNEAVKLAVKRGFGTLRGFVNGVLRSVAREEKISYPNPSVEYSVPEWLIKRWEASYGKEITECMLKAQLEKKATYIRCREDRVEEVFHSLLKEGVQVEKGAYLPYAAAIEGYSSLGELTAFQKGWFQVQDESSMLIGECAGIKKDFQIVDVCAAPGGKTTHAAEKLCGTGLVTARDVTPKKTKLIEENVNRLKLTNVEIKEWNALFLDEAWIKRADLVLADLPCSGLGVIGKKPDIKYHASEEAIFELRNLQRQILSVVSKYVAPGGILMYSTCTVTTEENTENALWFSDRFDFEIVSLKESLPESLQGEVSKEGFLHHCDGFFLAKFKRKDN